MRVGERGRRREEESVMLRFHHMRRMMTRPRYAAVVFSVASNVCRGRSRSLSRSSIDARRRAPRRARATIHPALEREVQQVVYRDEK